MNTAHVLHGYLMPVGHPRSDEAIPQRVVPCNYGRKPNAHGYGSKLPAGLQVYWRGRWRNLYCDVYGNGAGTAYMLTHGDRLYVRTAEA